MTFRIMMHMYMSDEHVYSVSKVAMPFELKNGFPPKSLVDPSATVSGAGLAGASLSQKI